MFGRLGTTNPNFGRAFVSIEEQFQTCYDVASAHLPEPCELAQCRTSEQPQLVPKAFKRQREIEGEASGKEIVEGERPTRDPKNGITLVPPRTWGLSRKL